MVRCKSIANVMSFSGPSNWTQKLRTAHLSWQSKRTNATCWHLIEMNLNLLISVVWLEGLDPFAVSRRIRYTALKRLNSFRKLIQRFYSRFSNDNGRNNRIHYLSVCVIEWFPPDWRATRFNPVNECVGWAGGSRLGKQSSKSNNSVP